MRNTPSSDRIAAVVAWGAIVSAATLVVVMLVMTQDDDPARDTSAGQRTTSALMDTASPQDNTMRSPGHRPGGARVVRAAADHILRAYNDRDSAPLRAWACDRTTITDDLFAGFSGTVRFARDGAPRIVGFTAKVPFVVSDSGRQRTGAMRLRWDGQRWCFVTAVSEPS